MLSALSSNIQFPQQLETPYITINGNQIEFLETGPRISRPNPISNNNDSTDEERIPEWLTESARLLRQNEAIAIPTETVYGLAANALSAEAVKKIFAAKNRPSDNPLIVHISSIEMLRQLYSQDMLAPSSPQSGDNSQQQPFVPFLGERGGGGTEESSKNISSGSHNSWPEIPEIYHSLIKKSWPGALTIVLPRPPCIPIEVLGGAHAKTVAFRFPSHPVARAIIAATGVPLAAPSANASGRPSPTLAEHVLNDLSGKIPLIVDGGQCQVGLESTVVDAITPNKTIVLPSQEHQQGTTASSGNSGTKKYCESVVPLVLRPGGITVEDLRTLGGAWEHAMVYKRDFVDKKIELLPTTPGMKYKHYSPSALVTLFVPSSQPKKDGRQDKDAIAAEIETMTENMYKKYIFARQQDPNAAIIGIIARPQTIKLLKESLTESSFPETTNGQIIYRTVYSVDDLAHQMFRYMREMDQLGASAIYIEGVSDMDAGLAIMNRLDKASTFQVIC
ncbi:hypothetical protein H4219_004173 [Mycoemilia scoparia]|uniref:Threonylcarbamoyl-AMP synthase n=1 Tax=Mycoemilia scoparia TaxID=417184 RepID=A0A9W8DLV2_9FUNG|nr:hypothetical protein H4219_004173 [Mycoemilia scoparia]